MNSTEHQKEAIKNLIDEVLDGTELQLKVDTYSLEESLETGVVNLRCDVHHHRTGEKTVIEGEGVGIVDAFFHGMVSKYSEQFPSLKTIRFSDFAIKANIETGNEAARSDMSASATLRVCNSEGREFIFTDTSKSITRSSINAVLEAAEFFINSERAFIAVYRALQHAREQNRHDSIQRYTGQLTTLVEATSYSDVIEQIRNQELTS